MESSQSVVTPVAEPRQSSTLQRLLAAPALLLYGAVLLAGGAILAFWYAPTDASTMGFSQKIFYFHVPVAETALLAFGVAFVAGILYLRSHDARYDRLGVVSIKLGLLFSLLVMSTGMIWGKAAWGVWWAWEPRLTTFLVACLLYAAYFVLRSSVDEDERRATYSALFAIIAFIDVPITFLATRLMPEGLHPVVFNDQGAQMDQRFLVAFMVAMAGMTLFFVGLLRTELAAASLREELDHLKNRLGR
ncbi:MAG TPA: cytochrome c biogenesis protein CcsA [Thermoleophilia bacterium]|nr:cytochrome c biogenesis protein CcsA [Thermoleophilia bacterium]